MLTPIDSMLQEEHFHKPILQADLDDPQMKITKNHRIMSGGGKTRQI